MAKRTKTVLLWVFFVALTCGGVSEHENGFSQKDGGLYLDDAVIINAAVNRRRRDTNLNSTRNARQLYLIRPRQGNEAFSLECQTTSGKKGSCKSYKDCYPLFKVADFSSSDGWLMGNYDTCSYINEYNLEVYGVCCTEPVGMPPQQQPDVQRWGVLPAMPYQLPALRLSDYHKNLLTQLKQQTQWLLNADGGNDANVRQIPANWPPPIPPLPTHPPNHAAPTHPPHLVAGNPTSPQPPNYEPQPTPPSPWPTAPPQQTTAQTTKQTWPPLQPTQPTVGGSCGIKNGPQTYESTYDIQDEERIVGGHNAELNEWPWIVALFNGGRQFCGGSLIDNSHVLSAAHCVAHMTSWDVARLTARLGDYNIRTNAETNHIERKIKRVVRHRGFDMRTLYNDVSVLTLDQPVTFTKNIRPICLPSGGARAYSGVVATVIGWGSLRENGPQPSVLQEVSIPVWTNSDCRLKYGAAAPGGIVEHMLCAGKASMDSCSGDSGGPLMVNDGGRWTQVGIVSWGIGCGKGQYPGVYSRVTSFLPWIQKNSQ